jgi:hypothetical protein
MSLVLSNKFRVGTHVVYPPFKEGRYMEEFFYDYFQDHTSSFTQTGYIYIPAFWTNFQIDDKFTEFKEILQNELDEAVKEYPTGTKFFTIVQYDDGVKLRLPENTLIFGACSGHIPLPLIYEDRRNTLDSIPKIPYQEKKVSASFVGSLTSKVRHAVTEYQKRTNAPWFINTANWTNNVHQNRAILYADASRQSKFVFATRGYGRSSFRFFEVLKLSSIPIYIWDDVEWLPYKDILNYNDFCISIHESEIPKVQEMMESVSEERYNQMLENYGKVKNYFELKGMSEYILQYLEKNTNLDILKVPFHKGQN